jgi:hypothetical protein
LLDEPSVVLGNVSIATAHALGKRIDAEILISYPKKELYTLKIVGKDTTYYHQIESVLKSLGIVANLKQQLQVENLDYKTSQEIWRKFQSTGVVKIINQEFQRHQIILNEIDENAPKYKDILTIQVGIQIYPSFWTNLLVKKKFKSGYNCTKKMDYYAKQLLCLLENNSFLLKIFWI